MDTSRYRSILVAVDLTEDTRVITRRGVTLAQVFDAHILLLHVVPPVPIVVPLPPEPLAPAIVQTQSELLEDARERMAKLAAELELPPDRIQVAVGDVRAEIARVADSSRADLIVVGSRERHGGSLFAHFSTEDRLLHRAPCDVLAVRVP